MVAARCEIEHQQLIEATELLKRVAEKQLMTVSSSTERLLVAKLTALPSTEAPASNKQTASRDTVRKLWVPKISNDVSEVTEHESTRLSQEMAASTAVADNSREVMLEQDDLSNSPRGTSTVVTARCGTEHHQQQQQMFKAPELLKRVTEDQQTASSSTEHLLVDKLPSIKPSASCKQTASRDIDRELRVPKVSEYGSRVKWSGSTELSQDMAASTAVADGYRSIVVEHDDRWNSPRGTSTVVTARCGMDHYQHHTDDVRGVRISGNLASGIDGNEPTERHSYAPAKSQLLESVNEDDSDLRIVRVIRVNC